jgi:hypothetical protein
MRFMKRLALLAMFPAAVLVGCGDNGSEPELLTVADFEGSWETLTYRVTSAANPLLSLEIISMGAALEWTANATGNFDGSAFIPALLAGENLNLDVQGTFSLISQDSVLINFIPEYPPFLTQTRAEFQLIGDMLSFDDNNSEFDFDNDGEMEAARFQGTFMRN